MAGADSEDEAVQPLLLDWLGVKMEQPGWFGGIAGHGDLLWAQLCMSSGCHTLKTPAADAPLLQVEGELTTLEGGDPRASVSDILGHID